MNDCLGVSWIWSTSRREAVQLNVNVLGEKKVWQSVVGHWRYCPLTTIPAKTAKHSLRFSVSGTEPENCCLVHYDIKQFAGYKKVKCPWWLECQADLWTTLASRSERSLSIQDPFVLFPPSFFELLLTYQSLLNNVRLTFCSVWWVNIWRLSLRHAGAAHRGRTHLSQHLIQPLEGAVEMELNPTGSAGYSLSSEGMKYKCM